MFFPDDRRACRAPSISVTFKQALGSPHHQDKYFPSPSRRLALTSTHQLLSSLCTHPQAAIRQRPPHIPLSFIQPKVMTASHLVQPRRQQMAYHVAVARAQLRWREPCVDLGPRAIVHKTSRCLQWPSLLLVAKVGLWPKRVHLGLASHSAHHSDW